VCKCVRVATAAVSAAAAVYLLFNTLRFIIINQIGADQEIGKREKINAEETKRNPVKVKYQNKYAS